MPLIVEGLLSTVGPGGEINLAPMGSVVHGAWESLTLRPFPGSTTCDNLLHNRAGVFHVTDDVEMLARAAVGRLLPLPGLVPCPAVGGQWIVADSCRWYALRVETVGPSGARYELNCSIVGRGTLREFFGFNRAKHAVVEAAILATRLHLSSAEEVAAEFARLAAPIEKTGGPQELRAFEFLRDFVSRNEARPR